MQACLAAALLALTLALYGRSLDEFLYKDDFVLLLRSRSEGLSELLVGRTLEYLRGEGETDYWRPGWWLLLKLGYACFGLTLWAHRALCLALHAGIVLAVQAIATRRSGSVLAGFAAGFLFAASPAFVEAVVWLSAATNVLPAAALILAAGLSWLRYLERGGPRAFAAALLFLALSLLFREAAYHLPLVFLLGWLCVRGRPRRWAEAGPLFAALLSSLAGILFHYTWLNQQRSPALSAAGWLGRILESSAGFATSFTPLGVDGRLALGGLAALVLVLGWAGSAQARYFLLWAVLATFPYVAMAPASRFAYFAAPPLAIGIVLGGRDLAARAGHAGRLVMAALGLAAGLGELAAFGGALEPYLEKGRTCARTLEACRTFHVERFDRLGIGLPPKVLWPGFDAMLELYLGKPIEVVNARIVPRPPFAVYLQPLPPQAPGTGFLAFEGAVPRLCAREELYGGLVPIQLVSFRRRWRVVGDPGEALRLVREGAADIGREVLLLEPPTLAYREAAGGPRREAAGGPRDEAADEPRVEEVASEGGRLVIQVHCPANAILVLAVERRGEPRVTVDGRPARALGANGRFAAVECPAGTRRVVWEGPVDV